MSAVGGQLRGSVHKAAKAPDGSPVSALLPEHDGLTVGQGLLHERDFARRASEEAAARAAAVEAARHEAALAAAYDRGVADGRSAVEREGVASLTRLTCAAEQAVALFGQTLPEQLAADTDDLLAAAGEIAAWFLQRELEHDPTLLRPLVLAVLAEITPSDTPVRLEVSDGDLAATREWVRDSGGELGLALNVCADPVLGPGEARVTAPLQRAEITVAEAMRRALRTLSSRSSSA